MDPKLSLAFSMHSNKGAYALLLGSGVSSAAGIATGWAIVLDLIGRLAAVMKEPSAAAPDPESWYRAKFGEEPDYTRLLAHLARTPAERAGLLRQYFEPTADEAERGVKLPTRAHKAIAALVASGHVRVIVTTNFDRLFETALQEAGVAPIVISTPDAAQGAPPLVHTRCTVLKVHGDYLDTRLKNTPDEVATYDARVDRLLDQIFDEFGVVIVGWSADWDVALRSALERCHSHRFTTYWCVRSPLSATATNLAALRRAELVTIEDADSLFVQLQEQLDALEAVDRPHPISTAVAVQRLKRLISADSRIDLHDLVTEEAERVYRAMPATAFPVQGVGINKETFVSRVRRYEALCETLMALFANGLYWGDAEVAPTFAKALERVANPPGEQAGVIVWIRMRLYPALLLAYAAGIAAVARHHQDGYVSLSQLLTRVRIDDGPVPLARRLDPVGVVHGDSAREWLQPRRHTPVSDHLFEVLRPVFAALTPNDARYTESFLRWEYLLALIVADLGPDSFIPLGQFAWREGLLGSGPYVIRDARAEIDQLGTKWPPLAAGFFRGDIEALRAAQARVVEAVQKGGMF